MAEKTLILPDLGEGLLDATVLEWLIAVGDHVERGDALVEVETTKSTVELPSPQTGTVARLHAKAGGTVNVGEPLITLTIADDQAGIVGTVPVQKESTYRVRLRPPED